MKNIFFLKKTSALTLKLKKNNNHTTHFMCACFKKLKQFFCHSPVTTPNSEKEDPIASHPPPPPRLVDQKWKDFKHRLQHPIVPIYPRSALEMGFIYGALVTVSTIVDH